MKKLKEILNKIFIDGMSGMSLGLFCTLIVGTILEQIAGILPGMLGQGLGYIAAFAKAMTGVGIGVGVACKFKESVMVTVSAGVAGLIGAFAAKILAGTAIAPGVITLAGPGEPLGAFIAAYVAITFGHLVSGKTRLDILVTPVVTITTGAAVGLLIGPAISEFMSALGAMVNWGTEQQPVLMGIIVSALMGIFLTLPISSAAIGVILGLSGIAAGAATAGCTCHMVGFAVMSFRENGWGGLAAQGLGTSMLQIPNLVKKPILWVPPVIVSMITGPISSKLLAMTSNATGSGMGTAGLVGPIMTYQTMAAEGIAPAIILLEMLLVYFILPAAGCLLISEFMRKKGWITLGDLKLDT